MNLKDENEIKDRLEKLVWKQVDLLEELGLGLQSGYPEINTDAWTKFEETKIGIGQLELEARRMIYNEEFPVSTVPYCQGIIEAVDEMPICENEIPF